MTFKKRLIIPFFFISCSSTTLIKVNDKNVQIFVDGKYKADGEHIHADTKIVGSTTNILLKKIGCEDLSYQFSRTERFDPGACIGGIFLFVPFLWIQKYKNVHHFNFNCTQKI
jgi:hypothetical protein